MKKKTRYVQVGLGGRHAMFRDAISKTYPERCQMVGVCDNNEGRVNLAVEELKSNAMQVPGYDARDFDLMIRETKPDCVVVTTRDSSHDEYICRAMELGCDVISEKPMTTDASKCRRILNTKSRTGKTLTVSFNYRYSPIRSQIKDLLMSGVIGNILSVDFHWMLDLRHGADYFRRWHRNKNNSGGLMVHKSTHHFDLVNWLLGTVPTRVYATGHRQFYTPQTADRYGLKNRGERCHGCRESEKCPFFLDMNTNENLRKLYLECEKHDGYYRDRCVFSKDIDIEDSMNVVVDYASGAKMSYSLNTYMPWEGYTIMINGTRGRLEHKCEETSYINSDGSVPGATKEKDTWTRICPHWQPAYKVDLWKGKGGHGGADPVMLAYIFDPENQKQDKLLRKADERAGAWSILTGVAANQSMSEGHPVTIQELVSDLQMPDYSPMPSANDPLTIPS